jgi:hypothetical protein
MSAAGCADNPFFVNTGESHHSPAKNGDENDEFPPCVGDACFLSDWGDLLDSYSTLSASNGPRHRFVINGPNLGFLVDAEIDGQPTVGATGDDAANDDDDDGVIRDPDTGWHNGSNVKIDFEVSCPGTDAVLAVWIDWDNDGAFQSDEFYSFAGVPCNAVYTGTITVPGSGTYVEGATVAVRVRLFADDTATPGGSLDAADFQGAALNGEVEDYLWAFTPTAVTLERFEASSAAGNHLVLVVEIVILLGVAAFILRRRSTRGAG